MIQIGDKIISRELFEEHFFCDLSSCKGECCIYGDAGAPLEEEEALILEEIQPALEPYLRPEGKQALQSQGAWVIDSDGEQLTPLIGNEECAYVIYKGPIALCAIEQAYRDGCIDFQKPISCHLYPIRVAKLKKGLALNYHRWGICEPARLKGEIEGLPVFRFLKDAICRAYGQVFYNELEIVYNELTKKG